MASPPTPLAASFAGLRAALEADRRGASFAGAAVLTVLLLLLGRLERMARTWHAAQIHGDNPLPEELLPYAARNGHALRVRLPTDGTHLVCTSPLLYAIGPGPGLGLRPHPRATPVDHPRIARAPPVPGRHARPGAPQRDRHPRRQIKAAQRGHVASP